MRRSWARIVVLVLCFGFHASSQSAPDYDTLVHQGNAQLQAGRNDGALVTAQSAIKLNADRWEAYALAGGALMNQKRYEEAADDFSKAIERAPEAKQQGLRDLRRRCFAAEAGAPLSPPPPSAPTATQPVATMQAEVVLWKSIENSVSPADFRSYLDQYPNGAFAVLAHRHLADIQAQAEQARWKSIENSSNAGDFQSYLKSYPNGAFVADARGRLADMESATTREIARQRDLPTWTDSATRLMWTQADNGKGLTWHEAMAYCESTRWAGYTDWRLPTIGELEGLLDKRVNVSGYHIKGNLHISPGSYSEWSSTSTKASDGAFVFSFQVHLDGKYPVSPLNCKDCDYSTERALCVRGVAK